MDSHDDDAAANSCERLQHCRAVTLAGSCSPAVHVKLQLSSSAVRRSCTQRKRPSVWIAGRRCMCSCATNNLQQPHTSHTQTPHSTSHANQPKPKRRTTFDMPNTTQTLREPASQRGLTSTRGRCLHGVARRPPPCLSVCVSVCVWALNTAWGCARCVR